MLLNLRTNKYTTWHFIFQLLTLCLCLYKVSLLRSDIFRKENRHFNLTLSKGLHNLQNLIYIYIYLWPKTKWSILLILLHTSAKSPSNPKNTNFRTIRRSFENPNPYPKIVCWGGKEISSFLSLEESNIFLT